MGSTTRPLLFFISCFLCAVAFALTTIYRGAIMTGSHQPKFEDGAQDQVNRRLDEMGKIMARLTLALEAATRGEAQSTNVLAASLKELPAAVETAMGTAVHRGVKDVVSTAMEGLPNKIAEKLASTLTQVPTKSIADALRDLPGAFAEKKLKQQQQQQPQQPQPQQPPAVAGVASLPAVTPAAAMANSAPTKSKSVTFMPSSRHGSVRLAEPLSSMPGAPGNGDNPDNPAMGANGVGVATTGATTGATTCTSTGCGCSWANSNNCKTSDGTICHKECCCKLAAMATVNFERFRGIANLVKLPDHHTFTGATLVLVDCGLLQEHVRELGSLGDEQGKTGVVFAVVD